MASYLFRRPCTYKENKLDTTKFPIETHVVNKIVCTNLYPMSHMSSLPIERVCFQYALLMGHSIDIFEHICYYMSEVFWNSTTHQGLPFPCLSQRLVTAYSMPPLDGEVPIDLKLSISAVTLK